MAVIVPGVPGNLRVPFLRFGIDNSQAGFFQSQSRLLLVGQKFTTGTAVANEPVAVFSGTEDSLFGLGSMLSNMVKAARENAGFAEIWALPLDDAGAGVASISTITVGGGANTIPGIVQVFIGGRLYRVLANVGDSNDDIASALADEINDDPSRYVNAVAATNVVTVTARHKGENSNFIDIRDTYNGNGTNVDPKTLTIAQTTPGAANPDVTTALANLGDEEFDWIGFPYLDTINLQAMIDEMDDDSGRWWAMRQVYGHVLTVNQDSLANLSAFGNALNSQHLSVMGIQGSPTVQWEMVAALAAKAAFHLTTAPELSRPLQTITLSGVLAPEPADRFASVDRNTLYFDGIGGFTVSRDGQVKIDRVLTTYQTNDVGDPDTSYLDIQVLAQLQYFIRYIRSRITQQYPRASLKRDTEKRFPGDGSVRPKDIRATVIGAAKELSNQNVIEDVETFAELLVVQISDQDPNVVEMVLSPDLVNQWRIGKILVQFYNQYPQA